jgi:hypothetical protein
MKAQITYLKREPNRVVIGATGLKPSLESAQQILEYFNFPRIEILRLLEPLGDTDNNFSQRTFSETVYHDTYFQGESPEGRFSIFFGLKQSYLIIEHQKCDLFLKSALYDYYEFQNIIKDKRTTSFQNHCP